jgi:predicted O-methyltransferase YrrM
MNLISQEIENYCIEHTTPESKNLHELNRETNLKVLMPQMLSGHLQGKFLELVSHMIQPQYILEIGTFTGYSAICMAKGLNENGKLITIDINEELSPMVKKYIALEKLENKIDVKIGNALEIIPQLDYLFDLVFIDADKTNYLNYFNLVIDKMKPDGWLLADNVLWSGKILDDEKDKDTLAIHQFNKKIQADSRVENMTLPLRDGIMIARKIG